LLVSKETYDLVSDQQKAQLIEIDRVIVKGKSQPVTIFGDKRIFSPTEAQLYSKALKAYYKGEWEEAHNSFAQER
ncbi:MAG: hypothetical protein HRT44_04380, partial [Bdellovibrionales bacterium]|nr:hypothetical protein [Bdellovibrionales bacterium]NQZ18481.1 hypothetical protein [Bdellovibrionales bacterium]